MKTEHLKNIVIVDVKNVANNKVISSQRLGKVFYAQNTYKNIQVGYE